MPEFDYSQIMVPVIVIGMAIAVLAGFLKLMKNYVKVPPERAAIIYGRKHKVIEMVDDGAGGMKEETRVRGYRIVSGGATLVLPFLESYDELDLSLKTISVSVAKVPTAEGVMMNVDAIANVKIAQDESSLEHAAEQFGGKSPEQIEKTIRETMEGHLRAICGTMTPEELYKNRQKFSQQVQDASAGDLANMGVEIISFPVKDVRDDEGYMEALGKKRVAEVKRDAEIGEAEAKRETMIKTSTAHMEGRKTELENEEAVAEAERTLGIKKATVKAEVEAAEATASQAGPKAKAEAERHVKVALVAAEEAETQARIGLAQMETDRVAAELEFKEIKPAEAKRRATVITAEGEKEAAIQKAEGIKVTADATREKLEKEGQGEAAATEARGRAQAEAKKADLLATAEGEKQRLLAEAEGKEQLAGALAKLDSTGKLLQVMEEAPEVARAVGSALAQALGPEGMAAIFGQIAAPLGSVDKIEILDLGGGNGNGHGSSPLDRFASVGPNMFFKFLANMKAMGLDQILEKAGLNSSLLDNFMTEVMDKGAHGEVETSPVTTAGGKKRHEVEEAMASEE